MKVYVVYHGCRYEGAGVDSIYINEKNAIKRAMRLVLRNLDINATKEDDWVWYDEYSLVAVKTHIPADLRDYNGESIFPNFLRYKDYLESIPQETLERMKTQAEMRKRLADRIKGLKPRK